MNKVEKQKLIDTAILTLIAAAGIILTAFAVQHANTQEDITSSNWKSAIAVELSK